MNPGAVQSLADVDIAETRDDALIEQKQLDRSGSAGQPPFQFAGIEIERFGPERIEGRPMGQLVGLDEIERPEPTGVVERKPVPIIGLDDEMVVLERFGRIDPPVAGHPEVEHEAVAAIGIDHTIFGTAMEADDASARQPLTEVVGKRTPQVRPPRLDSRNPPALQHMGKAADGRLDFGKLGHGAAIWRRAFNAARGTSPMTRQVNFGDQLVSPEEKTRRVGEVFSSVARRYDIMNDLMSGGMHRLWKDRFVNRVKPRPGEDILDMAGGTGDVAFRMARRGAHVTVSDINSDMLEVGKERARLRALKNLSWKVENAEALSFGDASFDAYTIVFGIRNVTDIRAALREAHRVLKRAGRFYCMEFSSTDWPGFGTLYETWADTMIPRIGRLVADDEDSYRYLVESIRRFPRPPAFRKMIAEAGFVRTAAEPMLGGLVTIHSGWKI